MSLPQWEFADALDRMFAMITDLGKKLDAEAASHKIDHTLLNTSIQNVQTQVLEKQGCFDANKSSVESSHGAAALPAHKLRFPKFDGTDNPLVWLHKGEEFFHAYDMLSLLMVWTTSFYLDGAASQWYYSWEKNLGSAPSWEEFFAGVNRRFGPPDRANPLGELAYIYPTRSVDEYHESFLNLLARCEDVSDNHQIALFTAVLLPPLCVDVELQNSATLEDAMALTRIYECCIALPHNAPCDSGRPAPTGRTTARSLPPQAPKSSTTPPASGGSSSTPSAPTKPPPLPGRFTRLSAEEMARHRLDGLCFNCPEKFSREHTK
jgi:hypothetical protein